MRHLFLHFRAGLVVAACAMMPPLAAKPAVQPAPATVPAANTNDYALAPGDELTVSFPNHRELNQSGPIGPDGKFAMPYIGQIAIAGLTAEQAQYRIDAALRAAEIVSDANSLVTVTRYGAVVYVGGEIRSPGPVPLATDMTPLQAVISAGGALDTARTKKVVIIRQIGPQETARLVVDLRRFANHGGAEGLLLLEPRDIIFVPRSSIAEVNLWIDQHINKLLPFSRSLNYQLGESVGTVVSP